MQNNVIWQKMNTGIGALLLTTAMLCLPIGCEKNSDDTDVEDYFNSHPTASEERQEPDPTHLTITPDSAAISIVGSELVFTAKGGVPPYNWKVTNESKGKAVHNGWSSCRYVCLSVGNNSLRVEDSDGHFALARITPVQDTMDITPDTVEAELSPQTPARASFAVQGGTPPYVWTVGNPGLGSISYNASTSYQASYVGVPGRYGINVVTVRDAEGRVATATITQNTLLD